jgi:hypothetical protein
MKSLFDKTAAEQLKQRMEQLTAETPRMWGKMSVAQMLAHCSVAMEVSLGDKMMQQDFIGKLIGKRVKKRMLSSKQIGKSLPTDKAYVVLDDRDLETERRRLARYIDRFQAGGPEGCTKGPHSFFGKMTAEEWAALNYIHLDHHLRQFGV